VRDNGSMDGGRYAGWMLCDCMLSRRKVSRPAALGQGPVLCSAELGALQHSLRPVDDKRTQFCRPLVALVVGIVVTRLVDQGSLESWLLLQYIPKAGGCKSRRKATAEPLSQCAKRGATSAGTSNEGFERGSCKIRGRAILSSVFCRIGRVERLLPALRLLSVVRSISRQQQARTRGVLGGGCRSDIGPGPCTVVESS